MLNLFDETVTKGDLGNVTNKIFQTLAQDQQLKTVMSVLCPILLPVELVFLCLVLMGLCLKEMLRYLV